MCQIWTFLLKLIKNSEEEKMNFNDSSLLFGFALFRDISLNLLKFYLTQKTTTCFELLILIRRLLNAKYSLHTNEKLRSQLFILKNSTFQLEWWAVSALCANDERTLNDIWWALVNGELDIRKERKRNCKVNGEHITWYVNAIWTLDKQSVRSVSRVIMFLCFVGNKKDQPINFL